MGEHSDKWLRRGGFACGLATVAAVVFAARVPAQQHDLGLDLTVVPAPPTTLTLKPTSPLITASGMRAGTPSGSAVGHAMLINPASHTQRVRLRALPSSTAIDRSLEVDVRLADKRIYHGPLRGMRKATAGSVVLQSGDGVPLRLGVRLREGSSGWRGRIEDVNLAFEVTTVPRR